MDGGENKEKKQMSLEDLAADIAVVRGKKNSKRKQETVNRLYAIAFAKKNRELFQFLESREDGFKPKESEIRITINRVSSDG
jgi:hypothetical protein